MIRLAKAMFEEEEALRPQGMAPSQYQVRMAEQEAEVTQQQNLEDLQSMNFSLKTANDDVLTYINGKLDSVQRPDGTLLKNILTDSVTGAITASDLLLSDGSIQIFKNGAVVSHKTPDGTDVFYNLNGTVSSTISKDGVETKYEYPNSTDIVLNSPTHQTTYNSTSGKIRQSKRRIAPNSTTFDQTIAYDTDGLISIITYSDGSSIQYTKSTTTAGTTLTAPTADFYIDLQGNKFHFSATGSISKITLPDGSFLTGLTWDSNAKVDGATLEQANGEKFIYQGKKLTRAFDAAGVETNYTHTTSSITAVKAGYKWEYLADKTPVKYTDLAGNVTTYIQSGSYKGLRERDTMANGQAVIYEYSGSGTSLSVQKREIVGTVYNIATIDGLTSNAQASNPAFRTTVNFANDGSIDQSAVVTATSGTKVLKLTLLPGAASTWSFNGAAATALGVTLNKDTSYKIELKWETGRVGIYVWPSSGTKPSTPTKTITDRTWDPTFKAVATNGTLSFDSTSSGTYNRNFEFREKTNSPLPASPTLRLLFTRNGSSPRTVSFKAVQAPSGGITRTLTWSMSDAGVWTYNRADFNPSTGATTNTSGTITKSIPSSVEYVAELRIENGKANLYIYERGNARPASPTIIMDAFNVSTSIEGSAQNAFGTAGLRKNLSTPTVASVQGQALTARLDTVKNLTLSKQTAGPKSLAYDANKALKEVLFKDNSRLVFDQGILKEAYDASGAKTTFSFDRSALETLTGARIEQPSAKLTSSYNAEGKLSSVKVDDMTIHYKSGTEEIEWIEKADGTEMWGLVFASNGTLQDAVIYTPDGEERTYKANKLVELRRPDQTRLLYLNQKLDKLITPEKLSYRFSYIPAAGSAPETVEALLEGVEIPDATAAVKMKYDKNFNLLEVQRQNSEILTYLDSKIYTIASPGQTIKTFDRLGDGSYSVTQGNVVTYYDSENSPLSAIISPSEGQPDTLHVSYSYGRIRQIKKGLAVLFDYSYSAGENGSEISKIEDRKNGVLKTYKDGDLLHELNHETQVLTAYEYGAADKISKVTVSRFNRTFRTYSYSYSGAHTMVADDEGAIRTYDSEGVLLFLERGGEKFAYTYQSLPARQAGTAEETALPLTTLDTSGRSAGSSWNTSGDSLYAINGSSWLEYLPGLTKEGDLKINFQAVNQDAQGLPPGYTAFKIEVFVDGVSMGIHNVPAHSTQWQDYSLTLTGLSAGLHTVRLKWVNNSEGSGGTDSNLKIRNLQFTQIAVLPAREAQEIATETLVERRLNDNTLIQYSDKKVSRIEYTDGQIFKDFKWDSEGGIKEVRAFKNTSDSTGTTLFFDKNTLQKARLSTGQDLAYSYEKDSSGNLVSAWIKKGAANLKYDAQGTLASIRLDGILTPEQIRENAEHEYEGGVGALSIDGNFDTAQTDIEARPDGGTRAEAISEHELSFLQPQVIQSIVFRMAVNAHARGSYTREYNLGYAIEVQQNGVWNAVQGSTYFNSGGDGSQTYDPGIIRLDGLNIQNVSAIRAIAHGFGNASGSDGFAGGMASIYEIQYTLANLADLSFSTAQNSSGQITEYSLSGYRGSLKFNANGAVSQPNPAYSAIQQELAGVIQNFASIPYLTSTLTQSLAHLADSEVSTEQEFLKDGTLESQTKADGSVTLFENGKPSKVLGSSGRLLIEYSYDASGNPTRVYLKNARDTLPDEIARSSAEIQRHRAEALRQLAAEKALVYQDIQNQSEQSRLNLEAQRRIIQSQYDQIAAQEARGKQAKAAKGDALNAINGQIGEISGMVAATYESESEAYASLDPQILARADLIEDDTERALTALRDQEAQLKNEILRQEISPVVYDYYRRILGRDPDTNEYNMWIGQVDYDLAATLPSDPVQAANPGNPFWAPSGTPLSIEAESHYYQRSASGITWEAVSNSSMSGGKSMSTPDAGKPIGTDIIANSPRLDYKIYFDSPGTYYLWVRGTGPNSAADSVHAGLDGIVTAENIGNFSASGIWKNKNSQGSAIKLTIATAGEHTINFWVREDGFRLDKFILSANASYAPAGLGEAESGKRGSALPLTQALQQYLSAFPELAERQNYVAVVKQAVRTAINSYLTKNDTDKKAYAATLGLNADDLIALSSSDAEKILGWLNSRSLHFGQSAFLALESLLDQKNIAYTRTDLATKVIVADILSGVISPLDDGDLVLSIYALNAVAKTHGLALTGAKIAWDDLRAIFQASPSSRIVAHINGNHFVIITGISNDRITYTDPGIGKDKQNESVTVTKEGFLKTWQGNVFFEQAKTQHLPNAASKILAASQAKLVRGAFWGSLLNLIGAVLSFTPLAFLSIPLQLISMGFSMAQGDWLGALSSAVSLGFSSFGSGIANMFKGAVTGFTNALGPLGQLLQGVGHFFGGVFGAVTGFANNLVSGVGKFFTGLGISSEIATTIARTAVSTGVSVAASHGLTALGVNPQIAGFAGSIAAGLTIGATSKESTVTVMGERHVMVARAQYIRQSLSNVTILQDVGQLGMSLGIDPDLTQILGHSLSAIKGIQILEPATSLAQAFSLIKPQLANSLPIFGIEKIGNAFGLDPKISLLIGAPINAGIGSIFEAGKNAGVSVIDSVKAGMLQGAFAYGVSFASGASHPILGSLLSRDITNNLARTIGRDGLFDTALGILRRGAINAVNVVSGTVKTVFEGIKNFGVLIQEMGLVGAFQSLTGSIFSRTAQESILQKGGVQAMVNNTPRTAVTLPDGRSAIELKIDADNSLFFDNSSRLIGRKDDGIYQIGSFSYDSSGNFGLIEGEVYGGLDDDLAIYGQVHEGQYQGVKIQGPSETLLDIAPEKHTTTIRLNENSGSLNFWQAAFKIVPAALSIFIQKGKAYSSEIATISADKIQKTTRNLYALANGIANPQSNPLIAPDYIQNLKQYLLNGGQIQEKDVVTIPLYQPTFKLTQSPWPNINQTIDVLKWLFESQNPINHQMLSQKVMAYLAPFQVADPSRPIVGMGYSGGFYPLVEAIAAKKFNVKSLVALGAATFSFNQDTLSVCIRILEHLQNWIADRAQTVFINGISPLLKILGVTSESANLIFDGIQNESISEVAARLIEEITQKNEPRESHLPSLAGTSVEKIINIWGTKDELYNLGIAGKRINLSDKPTDNIEIVGATHYDYMERGANAPDPPDEWNRTVADFISRLIRDSDTDSRLNQFYAANSDIMKRDPERNVWIVKLRGWENHQ